MPIIINELEIIPDPAPEASDQRGRDTQPEPAAPPPPDPFEILLVEKVYRERRRRLWAD